MLSLGAAHDNARRLRSVLNKLRSLSDPQRAALVSDLERRLAGGRLRVLLVGEAKRGKSTLGNALLGRDVLPTAVAPQTAVTTTVRGGAPERVEVAFADGRRVSPPLEDLACFVTEQGNPFNQRGVVDVTAFVDSKLPAPDMELVDTPGAGSVFDHNTTEAGTALAKMDVAIFVLTADPPISSSERDLLRRASALSVRTLVVINKVDRLSASERREIELFTADVVNKTVRDAPVDVFPCSAKAGLEARLRHDDDETWASSGVQALTDVLLASIRDSGSADLVTSLAATAERLAEGLLDETTLTLRTRELRAEKRSGQVRRFLERLDAMSSLRAEALAVVGGEALNQRKALDEAAAKVERQLMKQALGVLDRSVGQSVDVDTAQLEAHGAAALEKFVRSEVDAWREQRAQGLDDALQRLSRRQQELLDAAVSDLRGIARETLGVDLHGTAETVRLPASSEFSYTFGPEVSWNQPITSAVRHRLPGALGRRRVTARLRSDAERLVAKHIGRSRSDLQRRLEEAVHAITVSVGRTFSQHADRAGAAVQAATITVESRGCIDDEATPGAGGTDGDSATEELTRRAAELRAMLAELRHIRSWSIGNPAQGAQVGEGAQ